MTVAPLQLSRNKYAGGRLLTDPEGLVDDLNSIIAAMFLESLGDDQPPLLQWVDAGSINIVSPPGSSSPIRLTLQDFKQRTFESPVTLSLPDDLDIGVETADTPYHAYAVPDPTDPDAGLVGVLSANPPTVGPVGNTDLFRYLGAVWNNGASALLKFSHVGSDFFLHERIQVEDFSHPITPDGSPQAVDLTGFVPATAVAVMFVSRLRGQVGAAGIVYFHIDGSQALSHHDFIQVEAGSTNMQRRIVLPLPGATKQFYREINESSGDLDLYQLHLIGWVDGYLV